MHRAIKPTAREKEKTAGPTEASYWLRSRHHIISVSYVLNNGNSAAAAAAPPQQQHLPPVIYIGSWRGRAGIVCACTETMGISLLMTNIRRRPEWDQWELQPAPLRWEYKRASVCGGGGESPLVLGDTRSRRASDVFSFLFAPGFHPLAHVKGCVIVAGRKKYIKQ